MFCHYCGSKMPDDARFCGNCGREVASGYQGRPVVNYSQSQKNIQQKKSRSRVRRFSIVNFLRNTIMAAMLLCMIVVIINYVQLTIRDKLLEREQTSSGSVVTEVPVTLPASKAINPEYSAIFESRGLRIPTTDYLATPYETASYATVLEGDVLENMEFEYDNGIVLGMVDTVYVPVSGYDEATREQLDALMLEGLMVYQQMDFCTLQTIKENDYYIYKLRMTDLDHAENVRAVEKTGMITVTGSGDLIGIDVTEDLLLSSGFVKR